MHVVPPLHWFTTHWHAYCVCCRAVIPAIVAVEMTRPHSIAVLFTRFVWVLSQTPSTLLDGIVIHKWHAVFAGWGSEPPSEDALCVQLGVLDPRHSHTSDAPAAPRRRIADEAAEVRKYYAVALEVAGLCVDSIE